MRVVKKQPDTYRAVQWNGYNREDYIKFLKSLDWYDGIDAEYFDESNMLRVNVDTDYGGYDLELKEMGWIVFGYGIKVLTDKEFKEQYKEVKGC